MNGERSRANERHVAKEDVPKLWKLVEACGTQQPTDPRCPWIVFHFERGTVLDTVLAKGRLVFIGALLHGS